MRAKLVNEMTYEKMSVEQFVDWYNTITEQHPDFPWYTIVDTLVNDENSTDGDLYSYFTEELAIKNTDHIIEELLEKREYFMDFRYSQEIDAE